MIFKAHITAARIFITFSAFSQNIKEPVWSLSYYNNAEPWRSYIIHALCSAQSLFGRAGPPGSVPAPEAPPGILWGRMVVRGRSQDLRGTAGARGVQLISRRENKAAFGRRAGLISQPRAEASGGRRLLDYYSAGRPQQQQQQPLGVLPRGRCQVSQ